MKYLNTRIATRKIESMSFDCDLIIWCILIGRNQLATDLNTIIVDSHVLVQCPVHRLPFL